MGDGILRPITGSVAHLCVDMQRLFSAAGPWPTPWMQRVLPRVRALCEAYPHHTLFTRFVPPWRAEDMPGTWRRYYRKWQSATLEHLDSELLELMPPLSALVPPAAVIDKMGYSAFSNSWLDNHLRRRAIDTLVISGSETDVCVLSTVLGAVDRGYRAIVATDGVCSSSDEGHDSMLRLFQQRYSVQVETADVETILRAWKDDRLHAGRASEAASLPPGPAPYGSAGRLAVAGNALEGHVFAGRLKG